jgi:hypothetical protein
MSEFIPSLDKEGDCKMLFHETTTDGECVGRTSSLTLITSVERASLINMESEQDGHFVPLKAEENLVDIFIARVPLESS